MIDALATRGSDLAYTAFGKSAVYTDLLGGTHLLTVIEDTDTAIGPDGVITQTAEDLTQLTVRVSELATPERGGRVTLTDTAEVFEIKYHERADVLGNEWALFVRRIVA